MSPLTLLAELVRFYYVCRAGHRFDRAKNDVTECYRCGCPARLYGLKDSTSYAEERREGVPEGEEGTDP